MIEFFFISVILFFWLSSVGGVKSERRQKDEPWAPEMGVLYVSDGGLRMSNNLGHVWTRDSFDSKWRISR